MCLWRVSPKMVLAWAITFMMLGSTALAQTPAKSGPYMISYGVNAQDSSPGFIRDHLSSMEANLPFDGVGIRSNAGWEIMDPGKSVSYNTFMAELAPIRGLTFNRLKHNLYTVYVNRPADFFDDWSVTIQNFANLAAALKDSGIEGILFDNESYKLEVFNYPTHSSLEAQYDIGNPTKYGDANFKNCVGSTNPGCKTLEQYYDQTRLRGQQIMQAMVAKFPQIKVMFFHGPYDSFSGTPSFVLPNNVSWACELMGAFTVGFAQGGGNSNAVRDGGELNFFTLSEFQNAYQYRKYTFASDATNVPFIPASIRSLWPQMIGVDFEVYNQAISATTLQSTMTNALKTTDRYVWFYVEGINTLDPNSPDWMGQSFLNALKAARNAVPYYPNDGGSSDTTAPTVRMSSPSPGATVSGTVSMSAAASDNIGVTRVDFYADSTLIGSSSAAPAAMSWNSRSVANGSHSLSAKAYDAAGNVGTAAALGINILNSTPTPTPTATPTPRPSPSPTPTATATPRPSPSPTPTATATPRPSPTPTATATPVPTPRPSPTPSATPAPLPTRPAAPSNLAAKQATSRRVNLSWKDNSGNESGFVIQSMITSSRSPRWTTIGQVGPNVTAFRDTTFNPRRRYAYRVFAINTAGISAFSNVARPRR